MSAMNIPNGTDPAAARHAASAPDSRRWLILGVVGLAQLMVVLDVTIVNIALPSAQRSLGFSPVDRQWIVTAYALAFGSLLLLGGRLADLFGRKVTFLTGLIGFAVASAVGGAATSFGMLVAARACQGAFGALLAPAALSLLTTTFTDQKERGKAFGVFGAIAGAGGAVGLLLGGLLTEYLTWRWCLYVNLFFAAIAAVGASVLLRRREPSTDRPRLDIPGVLTVSGGMFCIVYGFSNAATHNWHTPSTWGFLAAGVILLAIFAWWQTRAPAPLLPPRVVLDRNRGAAYLSILIAGSGMFGIFLFLTYYPQVTLGYSPVITGVAFLPMIALVMVSANLATIVLMPRFGPRPLVTLGMLVAALGMVLADADRCPLRLRGRCAATAAGHRGRARERDRSRDQHRHVRCRLLGRGRGLGQRQHRPAARRVGGRGPAQHARGERRLRLRGQSHQPRDPGAPPASPALVSQALIHGYTTAFWWSAAIFACGAVIAGTLFRWGPLTRPGTPAQPGAQEEAPQAVAPPA